LTALLGFSYLESEFFVQFIEVNRKILVHAEESFALGVYCNVRVISLVGEEWRYPHGNTWSIIECELREWEKLMPIVSLVIAVYAEILFQCLVGAFSLSVAFRVISGSEVKPHVEGFSEMSEEVQDELCSRSDVTCDAYSVLGEHMRCE